MTDVVKQNSYLIQVVSIYDIHCVAASYQDLTESKHEILTLIFKWL